MKIKITFPDGRVAEYDKGTTSMQIASSISEGLARNVLGAKVNGIVVDASRPIQQSLVLDQLLRMDFITTSIQVIKYCLQMIFKKSNKRSLNWRDNPMSTSAPKYQKQMR